MNRVTTASRCTILQTLGRMSSAKSTKRKLDSSSTESKAKKSKVKTDGKRKAQTQRKSTTKASVGSDADDVAAGIKVKRTYPKEIDPTTNKEQDFADIKWTKPLPTRNKKGELVFPDAPDFRPNMTPKEVLQAGSFGGTYFRPIKSGVTGKSYTKVWEELPKDWLAGLDIKRQVASSTYREDVNTYGAKCGGSLEMWENSGWMHKQDPYGWFQWYCRFYQGRRTADDDRQIGRWLRCAGETGRWRCNLISKCVRSGCGFDNPAVSPVVRQTLQHWAYRLTQEDFNAYAKKMKKKGLA